jgi:1-acyl-sn-glycerol-3-phosphate acyltransferase
VRPARPGPLKYHFIRLGLRFFTSCYLRVRVEGARHPPDEPYLICFSHPSWLDPIVLFAFWPDRRWVFVFGPKEEDMLRGGRNRIIRWARLGVPFKPSRRDLLETTRRAVSVFRDGYSLAVAGEGRLSDEEGAIVPLQDGPAFFALRGQVPIVPVAIIGTRWVHFGKRVTLRIGPPIDTHGRRADRQTVTDVTAETQAAVERLLVGVRPDPPPGRFGRWLSDVFSERPWLEEERAGEEGQGGEEA